MYHVPIMVEACIQGLNIKSGGVYLDCTLGGGGHSREILKKLTGVGRLLAFDKDIEAIEHNKAWADKSEGAVQLKHTSHEELKSVLEDMGVDKLDGILFDLGLSSHQIDDTSRGFSYSVDAPLDMRMDTRQTLTAKDIVNTYSEERLAEIIYKYGEEDFSRRIARNIIQRRAETPINTTGELADIVRKSVPFHKSKGHPAKKTFQAIRIEVNGELTGLEKTIRDAIDKLAKGGRLAVMSFHSLEDRIVKRVFNELTTDCLCDKSLPVCVCGHKASLKYIVKMQTADKNEIAINPRSESAKLRIVEKII